MSVTCKAGLIKLAEPGPAPNFREVATRLGFAQTALGLNAVFLEALQNAQGEWVVPFLCVEGGDRFSRADAVIQAATPYEILGLRIIDVSRCDLETIRKLRQLVPIPGRPVRVEDLRPKPEAIHIERPEDVFNGLVGMNEQKKLLIEIATAVAKHGRDAIESFHFVFKGAPGTGKTELAMRFSAYLDHIGVTDGSGRFVKAGEPDLVGAYVGQTAPAVDRVVDSALGGVLFIDEFYSLANADSYGFEALDELTNRLDTCRHELVCIIAGYPTEMDATLAKNPGLKDRFGYEVIFPDYAASDLAEIFVLMAEGRGFEVEDQDAVEKCAKVLRGSVGFSNARTMRKLVDHAVLEASTARDEAKISADDVFAATNRVLVPQRVGAFGFC